MRYLSNNIPVTGAPTEISSAQATPGGINPSIYDADRELLGKYLFENGLQFEGRPLPVEINPYLVSAEKEATIRDRFSRYHALLERIIDLYVRYREIREHFAFSKSVEELILLEYPYSPRIHLCRFDFTFDRNQNPVIYENNSECPGGLLLMRKIFSGYRRTRLMQDISGTNGLKVLPCSYYEKPVFSASLLDIYNSINPKATAKPVIGLLNSRHNTLTTELDLMAEELSALGCETVPTFVEDLEYSAGRLLGNARPLDMCYQKFDSNPNWEYPFTPDSRCAENYLRALRDGNIIGVNSFASSYLIESKAVLSLLWERKFERFFSEEELALGREVTARTKMAKHLTADEAAQARQEQNHFILKKSFDTRGRSVVIGRNISAAAWEKALYSAIADDVSGYVLQRYLEHESCQDSSGQSNYISHAYFIVRGEPAGMLTRFSADPVTNVGRNGSLGIPLIVSTGAGRSRP